MNAEIISVGTELLMGQIVNTDAQFIAQRLAALGINLYRTVVVGDNLERLTECIFQAAARSDIVILSGGLGPTEDDLTKDGVAKYLGVELVRFEQAAEHVERRMKRYNRPITPNNYRQAMFPEGSRLMRNTCGTAMGCICEKGGKSIIVLPGPPHELSAMFEDEVWKYLLGKSDCELHSVTLKTFGIGESTAEHVLRELIDAQTNPTIATYAGLCETSIRVTAKTARGENALAVLRPTLDAIYSIIGEYIYSDDGKTLPQTTAKLMDEAGVTVSAAESLTGGLVCALLVDVEGMSRHLKEGAVVYSNEAKIRLGVKPETLEAYTAVSEQTAIELARAVRIHTGTDIGVSTTGVAGPGADADGNPEGLAFIGISTKDGESVMRIEAGGSRDRIRNYAALTAIDMIRKYLKGRVN